MPRLEKFSENALKSLSSWNWTLEGEGSEDKEAPERRGLQVGVDLHLGAIDTTNVIEIEGEKEKNNQKSSKQHQ